MHMATTEEKSKKFKLLAEKRTERILDDLRLLGNLSNTSNYEFDETDVDKIFTAIELEVGNTKSLFKSNKKGRKFTL